MILFFIDWLLCRWRMRCCMMLVVVVGGAVVVVDVVVYAVVVVVRGADCYVLVCIIIGDKYEYQPEQSM